MKPLLFGFVLALLIFQSAAPPLMAAEEDLKKAKELNDSQRYDSLYMIPELKALYYQNNHIIELLENIDTTLKKLLLMREKKSDTPAETP